MTATSPDAGSITFDLDALRYSIDLENESHRHGMVVRFEDPATTSASCKTIMVGKKMPENPMTLKRVR